jgi:DNA-binding protein H-NS
MVKLSLEKMTLNELKALAKDIDKAIKTYEARKLIEARVALEAKARELGVSLEAVFGPKIGRRKTVASSKYRHPENSALTWTGRGRVPNWVSDHEAKGGSRDDLLIS